MKNVIALGLRSVSFVSLFACAGLSLGCGMETIGDDQDMMNESEDVDQAASALMYGTDTISEFEPVVRIETAYGTCTATAISDDVLVTAANCLKSGTKTTSWIKVRTAHGANVDSQGKYASGFIMPQQLLTATMTSGDYKRDIAFVKFGAGTFSKSYNLAATAFGSTIAGQNVTLVGFGGTDIKSYGHDIVTMMNWTDANYALAYTNARNGVADFQSGDQGGPILRRVGTTYEIVSLLSGMVTMNNTTLTVGPVITAPVYNHINPVLSATLPATCTENYQYPNFIGWSVSFCDADNINLAFNNSGFSDPFSFQIRSHYSAWDNNISSAEVPDDTIITFYDGSAWSGNTLTLQTVFPFGRADSVSSFANSGFNDVASSYRIDQSTDSSSLEWQIEISGKCLDLRGGNTANGSVIQQWDCQDGNTNQIFRIEQVDYSLTKPKFQIKHVASGKCLQAPGYPIGQSLQLWTCNGSDSQRFVMIDRTGTSDVRDFEILSTFSGLCINLKGGLAFNGATIQMWTCDTSTLGQNFALKKVW